MGDMLIRTIAMVSAIGVGGTAYAASGPSASGAQSASRSSRRAGIAALLRRTDHASVEIKVKGQWVTYTVDRGKVTAVSPTAITVARPDGQSVTEAIGPNTKFRGVTSESAVQTGRPAVVVSEAGTAVAIGQSAHPARTSSDLGGPAAAV